MIKKIGKWYKIMAKYFGPKKGDHGLSQLQKHIIALGKKNDGVVSVRDVLVVYYGFKPHRSLEGLRASAIVFRKKNIGTSRYNSANVAVCKAFNRLCDRGMAIRIHGGIKLKNG